MTASPQIRTATNADYTHFARLFPELGTPDAIPSEARWRAEIEPNVLVLESAGEVVGYTFFQQLTDSGYIRHLVVAKEHRRKGYGRLLLIGVRDRLRAAGRTSWSLNVELTNAPAVALYESLGMRFAYNSCAARISWSRAKRAGTSDIAVVPFGPEEDGALERAFSLPAGQVVDHRPKPERVFLKAMRDGDTCGFTVFDRLFPGLYPICVRSVDAGWKLLEAAHLRARSEDDHIRLLIDDNDTWRAALVDAGAEVLLEVAHYRGALTP